MTKCMSVYDYYVFLEEVKPQIIGKNFEKIYQPEQDLFLLKFGKEKLVIKIPCCIFISKKCQTWRSPLNFTMFLRKRLSNAKLEEISLVNNDRIIKMIFDAKNKQFNLIFEMFGKGNVILTDNKNIILNVLNKGRFRGRNLIPGEEYLPPIKPKIEFSFNAEDIRNLLSDRYIISCLSKLPLGIKYLDLILKHIKVNPEKIGSSMTDDEIVNFIKTVDKMKKHKKFIFINDNFYATDLFVKKESDIQMFSSFNALLEYYYLDVLGICAHVKNNINHNAHNKKIERKLAAQEEHLNKLFEKEKRYKDVINFMNKNILMLDDLISLYRSDRDKLKRYNNIRIRNGKLIIKIKN